MTAISTASIYFKVIWGYMIVYFYIFIMITDGENISMVIQRFLFKFHLLDIIFAIFNKKITGQFKTIIQ